MLPTSLDMIESCSAPDERVSAVGCRSLTMLSSDLPSHSMIFAMCLLQIAQNAQFTQRICDNYSTRDLNKISTITQQAKRQAYSCIEYKNPPYQSKEGLVILHLFLLNISSSKGYFCPGMYTCRMNREMAKPTIATLLASFSHSPR